MKRPTQTQRPTATICANCGKPEYNDGYRCWRCAMGDMATGRQCYRPEVGCDDEPEPGYFDAISDFTERCKTAR
jgi:hypothetical protein